MRKHIFLASALCFLTHQGFSQIKRDIQVDSTKVNELGEVILEIDNYKKNYISKNTSESLRLATPIKGIAQNIQVIKGSTLRDQQVLSMSDGVLRNVSGATRIEHWADKNTRINMRGSRVGAFLNGANVSSSWGPLSEDMSYVERIEFVKGPAGFMMSNGEPSGIYNVVTKKPIFAKGIHGSVGTTIGSFDLYRGEGDINAQVSENIAVRLNAVVQNKKSFRKYEFNDRYIFAPSVSFRASDKTIITAEYIYQRAKMSEVGSAYVFSHKGYKAFPRETTNTDPGLPAMYINEHYANLNLQSQLSDNWKLTSQISFMRDYENGGYMWPDKVLSDDKLIRSYGLWQSINDMKFGQVYLNGNLQTGSVSHKTLFGLDLGNKHFIADWGQDHNLDKDTDPFDPSKKEYTPPSNGYHKFDTSTPLLQRTASAIVSEKYAGVYVQDELGFMQDRIRLTLAGRFTNVNQSSYGKEKKASKFTPRIGVSGDITSDLTVYALYDQAFIPQSGLLRNKEAVLPITGDNMELGLKKDWFGGKWNTTFAMYRIVKNNELTRDPNNAPTEQFSIVKGQSVAKGIELDVKGEIFTGMNLILNYALTDNEITKSNVPTLKVGDKVAGYAKHNFNTWLDYTLQEGVLKGFGASLGFTFLGDRTSWDWNNDPNIKKMDDYRKWNGGLFWENNSIKVNFNVFNIFDEYLYSGTTYSDYYYYQAEAPRNYRVSVSFKF